MFGVLVLHDQHPTFVCMCIGKGCVVPTQTASCHACMSFCLWQGPGSVQGFFQTYESDLLDIFAVISLGVWLRNALWWSLGRESLDDSLGMLSAN